MKIINIKIQDLKKYEKNAKKHPKKQIDILAKNIERFGFTTPILIDKNNEIIAGHGRLDALKKLKMETAPCVIIDYLNEEEIRALRLADNKIAEMGEWDSELALNEFKELEKELQELTGFEFDIYDGSDKDDIIPTEPKVAKSKLGDVYELGKHRVMCGDSTKREDVELLMNNQKADLVFTDPPYNVNYKGKGKETSNGILNDKMSSEKFDNFLLEVFKRYDELSKGGSAWYIFHSSTTQHQFQKAIEAVDWKVFRQLIWNKPSASNYFSSYGIKHEPFFYCGKNEEPKFYGKNNEVTIFDLQETEEDLLRWVKREKKLERQGKTTCWTMQRENVNSYVHPTQKPIELISKALFNSSKTEDLVVDLFGGSGSTLIACEKLNRGGYLMELDPVYVDVIVQRWVDFTGNENIIKNGEEIIWKKSN